jgi:PHD/YefM family antitoxin component YafN of YafNO toxin-antitoxin module
MKTVEIDQANDSLRNYAGSVRDTPLVITDSGKPVAALLSLDNVDMETVSLSTNPKFLSIIENSRRRQDREGGASGDEMRKRLGADNKTNGVDG